MLSGSAPNDRAARKLVAKMFQRHNLTLQAGALGEQMPRTVEFAADTLFRPDYLIGQLRNAEVASPEAFLDVVAKTCVKQLG